MLTGGNFSHGGSASGSGCIGLRPAADATEVDPVTLKSVATTLATFTWVIFLMLAIALTPIALVVWSVRVIFGF